MHFNKSQSKKSRSIEINQEIKKEWSEEIKRERKNKERTIEFSMIFNGVAAVSNPK